MDGDGEYRYPFPPFPTGWYLVSESAAVLVSELASESVTASALGSAWALASASVGASRPETRSALLRTLVQRSTPVRRAARRCNCLARQRW